MGKMNNNARSLLLFSLVFASIYKFSLWYASSLGPAPSFVFSFENKIPFLAWTIVPYLSSGIFFCWVFFLLKSKETLSVFRNRVILMTTLAGIAFVFMPLQYAFTKPEIHHPVYKVLFNFLDGVDDPYNQSPSLHVAFSFAFWTVFRERQNQWKIPAAILFVLIALSTLTTYQHHIIDIFTGSILAHLVFILIPLQPKTQEFRNLHIANFYFLFAWCLLLMAFILGDQVSLSWFNLGWLSLGLFLMGFLIQKYRIVLLQRKAIIIYKFINFF